MASVLDRRTIKEILELSDNPTMEEVKKNYKRLVRIWHPDINKSPEAEAYMKKINQAYKACQDGMERYAQQQQRAQHVRPRYTRTVIVTFGGGYKGTVTFSYDIDYY